MRKVFKTILLIDVVLFSICRIFSWLLTNLKLADSLIWAGLALILIGALAAMGGNKITFGERVSDRLEEREKSYDFCLILTASAIVPIAIGWVLS